MKNYYIGVFYVLLSAVGFSAKSILVKLCYQTASIDAVSMLALRMLFALPFFAVSLYWTQRRTPLVPFVDMIRIFLLAILGYYLASLSDFAGLKYISASLERIIVFTYPTLVFVITYILYRKKPNIVQFLALLLTYTGIFIAYSQEVQAVGQQAGSNVLWGTFLVFVSSLSYGFYLVGCGNLIPRTGAILFTGYAMVFSCLQLLTHNFLDSQATILGWDSTIYSYALIMAIFCTIMPAFALSKGIAILGSGNASLLAGLGPVITIGLAHIFLEEKVTFIQVVGAICVIAGVLIISLKGKK